MGEYLTVIEVILLHECRHEILMILVTNLVIDVSNTFGKWTHIYRNWLGTSYEVTQLCLN